MKNSPPLPTLEDIQRLDPAFYPYQQRWLQDESRFKIGLWARQTGKDYTSSAEAIFDMLLRPKTTWVILAASERQSLETLQKAIEWTEQLNNEIDEQEIRRPHPGALLKAGEIRWSNGSRLIALPARPQTVRGFSANLVLTEFAFHDDPEAIWRAIYPSISNPLRGGKKKLRIISTPNGRDNLFAKLWHTSNYSTHRVTIHDAVREGLPIDLEELRSGLNDPEAWQQEYDCNFLDTASVLLPYDLILKNEDHNATVAADFSQPSAHTRWFAGIDFGRKHDRTVCWMLELVGDVLWTREVLVLDCVPTPEQIEILRSRLNRASRVCFDATGPGLGLGDFLAREFGECTAHDPTSLGKVELCQFNTALKNELFSKLRLVLELHRLRLPFDIEVREDLHSMQRVIQPSGEVAYRAPRTAAGHSDRCTALALALRAAEQGCRANSGGVCFIPKSRRFHRPCARR